LRLDIRLRQYCDPCPVAAIVHGADCRQNRCNIRRYSGLIHHVGEDTLVGWAWAPGAGRSPAPGTQKQAGALVEAWVKTGAACPAK